MSKKFQPKLILTWLYDGLTMPGMMVPLAAGLAVSYYVGGGLPGQGQTMMQTGQAYLAGGVAFAAVDYAMSASQSSPAM